MTIKDTVITGFSNFYQWANREVVKENIKWGLGLPSFFGIVGFPEIIINAKNFWDNKKASVEKNPNHRVIWFTRALGHTSLVLSASISPLGRNCFARMTPDHVAKFFEPNVNFATNPWHPRHIASFIAFGTGMISLGIDYTIPKNNKDHFLNKFVLYNLATCRPTQHIANRLFQRVFRK